MTKMVVDTHTHTIASGHAYSTIIENCREAANKGIKIIGMADHGPKMPGGPHLFHFGNLHSIPEFIDGVEILKGCEANIIDYTGKLDIPDTRLNKLELVIASLHDVCIISGSVKDNTRAYIGAMRNKNVDIMGHPGNPAFPIDITEVLKAALDYNVMIEINNSSLGVSRPGSIDNCRLIASKAAELGNIITIGSDAHICYKIGEFDKAISIIQEAGIEEEKVINIDENKIRKYLKDKGKLKNKSYYNSI